MDLRAVSTSQPDPIAVVPTLATSLDRNTLLLRIGTLLAALAVLYIRLPTYFTNPQFWGEDIDFFDHARSLGWTSLFEPVSGYFNTVQKLVAILAGYFNPIFAPAIFVYTSFALTLVVVWLVTSPRLELPYRPLLALAILLVPMGQEEIGHLVNIIWILPIGVFALLLMTPARSRWVLLAEAVLVGLVSVSGVLSIILTPLFVWRLFEVRRQPSEFRRLLLLTLVIAAGSLVQVGSILLHPETTNPGASAQYSVALWINLPLSRFVSTFGLEAYWPQNKNGVLFGLIALAAAGALACSRPYRTQKLLILLFALGVAFSGLLKFRHSLETQLTSQRYFYIGSVFTLWFICCAFSNRHLRYVGMALVAVIELMLLPIIARTPLLTSDLQWPVWASFVDRGLPVTIPTAPPGWYVSPAPRPGDLTKVAGWIGTTIPSAKVEAGACSGMLAAATNLPRFHPLPTPKSPNLWMVTGYAWSAKMRPVQLVLLANQKDSIIGFGLPGFQDEGGTLLWKSVLPAGSGTILRAYGLLGNGTICRLEGKKSLQQYITTPIASDQYVSPVQLVPGHVVVQRFKPEGRFEEIRVRMVTFSLEPSGGDIAWKVVAFTAGQATELGAGKIDPRGLTDWGDVDIPLSTLPDSVPDEVEVTLSLAGTATPVVPVGVPLFKPTNQTTPAVVAGVPMKDGTQVGIRILSPVISPQAADASAIQPQTPPAAALDPITKAPSTAIESRTCRGYIDAIDSKTPASDVIKLSNPFDIRGWLADDVAAGTLPGATYVTLTGSDGSVFFIRAKSTERDDVATSFKQPGLKQSGFQINSSAPALHGAYKVGLALETDGKTSSCSNIEYAVELP